MFFTKALSLIIASLAVATQAFPAPAVRAEAQIGPTHIGDATWYTPGLGACGRTNNPNELVAAAAATVFDTFPGATSNPNNNPICGKQAVVTYGAQSITVTIVDRCPGCGSAGIDLSPAAFQKFGAPEIGVFHTVQWTVQ